MPEPNQKPLPDQLLQIAKEQEGGAEQVINQIEVVQNSFEEILSLIHESQEVLARLLPPSPEKEALTGMLESISTHADNGLYNVQSVYDLFQYQDIVRQKLEKVGHRLIDVSKYVLTNLCPNDAEPLPAPAVGRDILERDAQAADQAKGSTDAIIQEFFAKLRSSPTPQ